MWCCDCGPRKRPDRHARLCRLGLLRRARDGGQRALGDRLADRAQSLRVLDPVANELLGGIRRVVRVRRRVVEACNRLERALQLARFLARRLREGLADRLEAARVEALVRPGGVDAADLEQRLALLLADRTGGSWGH